jgi:DNA-binding response OmpR family regulator
MRDNLARVDPWAYVAELEDEIQRLRRQLRMETEVIEAMRVSSVFGLTTAQAKIVLALRKANGAPVSRDTLTNNASPHASPGTSDRLASVHIHRIRRKIGWNAIGTLKGFGYWMTPEGVAVYDRAMNVAHTEDIP